MPDDNGVMNSHRKYVLPWLRLHSPWCSSVRSCMQHWREVSNVHKHISRNQQIPCSCGSVVLHCVWDTRGVLPVSMLVQVWVRCRQCLCNRPQAKGIRTT